jgi:hypothetical protein
VQVNHAVTEVLEDDVAAVLGYCRTDTRFEELLYLRNDLVVVGRSGGGLGGVGNHRIA